MQLSEKCGVEVIILIYDRKQNKLNEFCTAPNFKLTHANQIIEQQYNEAGKKIQYQTVHSYTEMDKKIASIDQSLSQSVNLTVAATAVPRIDFTEPEVVE